MTAPSFPKDSDWSALDDLDRAPVARPPAGDRALLDPAAGISLGSRRSAAKVINQVAMFRCDSCHGIGRFVRGYMDVRDYGPCNKCKGTGKLKTDPGTRARRKQARVQAKVDRKVAYTLNHKPEHAWVVKNAPRFDFARSMLEAVDKYGEWTDGQLAAIRRCMAKDQERAQEHIAQAAAAPSIQGKGFERMVQAFTAAKASGLKYPKFHAAGLTFSVPGDKSKYRNEGGFFVKAGDTYLGRIDGAGRWLPVRGVQPEQEACVREVCADPFAAAVLHGKQTGRCSCCGRELENAESVALGIGPVCRAKWGL